MGTGHSNAELTLTPARDRWDWPRVTSTMMAGTICPPHTVTLTNTGSTPLNVRGIGILGNNFGDFVETTTCGSSVPAHSSCAIDVRFAPAASGRRGASIKVRDDGGGTQAVPLAGTGVPR